MVSSTRARLGGAEGFSLLELLMAMTISVAIMGSIVAVAGQLQRSYYVQLDGAAVQQEGRHALDWILRTLQSAGSNPDRITVSACPSTGTTFRVVRRDPNGDTVQNDIRIHSDLNPPNGLLGGLTSVTCTESGEDITIALDTTNSVITRRDNNTQTTADVMTDAVITGLTFTYLNGSRATATTDDAVAWVQVSVTSQTPTVDNNTGQRPTYTHTGEVRIRTR